MACRYAIEFCMQACSYVRLASCHIATHNYSYSQKGITIYTHIMCMCSRALYMHAYIYSAKYMKLARKLASYNAQAIAIYVRKCHAY